MKKNSTKVVVTNLDESVTIVKSMYFVCATDKFLSGWGCAENRICKRVIICDSYKSACRMADAFKNNRSGGLIYVNVTSNFPNYPASRYITVYSTFNDFSNWLKWSNIPE